MEFKKKYYSIEKTFQITGQLIGWKKIIFFENQESGLKGYVVINDVRKGWPALGGTRMFPYPDQKSALEDCIRLAEAMDLKLAFAGVPKGGAKTVIIGDPTKDKTEQLLITFGEFLEFIGGEIHVGEDMGIDVDDLKIISLGTGYCTPGKSTASATARGVYGGIRACFKKVFGDESFRNRKIAIQGIGKVGYELANLIHKSGGDLILADTDESVSKKAAKDFDAKIVKAEAIYSVPCDVFSPCAMGNVITGDTIRHLNCKIIAGGANNQLQRWQLAYKLSRIGILYAPDYIINSGGVTANWFKKDENWVERKIYKEILKLIKKAESRSMPPLALARDLTVEKNRNYSKSFKGYLKYEN